MRSTSHNIRIRILVIDDEQDILFGLKWLLELRGHYVKIFDKPRQALEHLASPDVCYDLVITDYRMPGGMSGLEVAKAVKESNRRKARVFLMTAFDISSLPELNQALELKVIDEIIQKPIPSDQLIAIIEKRHFYHNH
ncbi:MAG: response regulator [Thermoproteota archaeon]|nr:response regulator [Thermoproteota archaeon]